MPTDLISFRIPLNSFATACLLSFSSSSSASSCGTRSYAVNCSSRYWFGSIFALPIFTGEQSLTCLARFQFQHRLTFCSFVVVFVRVSHSFFGIVSVYRLRRVLDLIWFPRRPDHYRWATSSEGCLYRVVRVRMRRIFQWFFRFWSRFCFLKK